MKTRPEVSYGNTHTIRWIAGEKLGRLAIRVRYVSFGEPKETVYFYPTAYQTSNPKAYRNLIKKKVIYNSTLGCFQLSVLDFPDESYDSLQVFLKDGKGTKALHTIIRDIPAPEGQEWHRGKWKDLK